ncbi:MAG: patatin-like phospholipase family protein [Candidatus Binatia bacterium]
MSFAGMVARHVGGSLAFVARRVMYGAAPRLDIVPQALRDRAELPRFPDIRYRSPSRLHSFVRDAAESLDRERAHLRAEGHVGPLPPAAYLAISGGGDKGAFGAGLLAGWSAAGSRPVFKVVTGVSTGALIAPLAFLGPAYDDELRSIYTGVGLRDICTPRAGLGALLGDAISDTAPLSRLVRGHIDRRVLDAIAAEHRKGRMLLVGTTDLDAGQGVIWNLTKIAASGDPQAADLVHRVLIASSAIPAAFPPMLFEVEADGRRYQEMHVDGGAAAQVFFYPPALPFAEVARARAVERERRLYVIRNSRPEVDAARVEPKVMSIASRAIASLIHTQGRGDLYRLYFLAQRDGVGFNLAYIPQSFDVPHPGEFDTPYMRRLYALGYEMASRGYPWEQHPPDFGVPSSDAAVTST